MKNERAALGLFAVLVLAGCASVQVQTDYDPHAPFEQLKTYTWSEQAVKAEGDPAVHSSLVARRVQHAVDTSLGRMGYRRVTDGSPDFRLEYRIGTERRTYHNFGSYDGFGYGRFGQRHFGRGLGYGHYDYGYGGYGGSNHEYVEALLALDLVDARTDELIWRGWATDALAQNPTPKAVRKYIDEAVEKILEEFPTVTSESSERPIATHQRERPGSAKMDGVHMPTEPSLKRTITADDLRTATV